MTDADESPAPPQSIQERIAALKLNQVGRTPASPPPNYEQVRKSKPPPPPLPKRSQTASVPTITSNGDIGNTPAPPPRPPVKPDNGVGGDTKAFVTVGAREVLPAPVMKKWEGRDNDSQRQSQTQGLLQKKSPALPPRRPSEQRASPSLPPRRPSEQDSHALSRKQSTDSISSVASRSSSISAMSLKSNGDRRFHIRAPEFDPSSLPPLPQRNNQLDEVARMPLRPTVSAPNVPKVNVKQPPALPGRPALPVRNGMPAPRETPPPPSRPRKSVLELGFKNKVKEEAPPPIPSSRPNVSKFTNGGSLYSTSKTSDPTNGSTNGHLTGVVELTTATFDDVVLRGNRPVFVDFYAPFCKHCKTFDPRYEQLAERFSQSNMTFARIDSYTEKDIGEQYQIESWPTLKIYDGRGNELGQSPIWNEDKPFNDFVTKHTGFMPNVAPPIPTGSRPNLLELNKTKPKNAAASTMPSSGECLKCRDFSAPDAHAARFPRQSIPNQDPSWLGPQLCDPFPSHTDKARAIFTWLHLNVDYDVQGFFSGNIPRGMTSKDTIASGLAVCEGYAKVFVSLALAAGLESVMVCGHGKGFGFDDLRPGQPLPRRDVSGHAWSAVRIDGGVWKLMDPCWGAGNVSGRGQPYNRAFNPSQFTMSNDEFGERHYPENSGHFFRDDGRPSITWEEYIMFSVHPELCTVFTPAKQDHGFDDKSFRPKENGISKTDPAAAGATIRFQWTKICPHYDIERIHGKPYAYFMKINDKERYAKTDGYNYWIDVGRDELPAVGQDLAVQFVQKYMDASGEWRDARGLSERECQERYMWRSWSWSFVAKWKVI